MYLVTELLFFIVKFSSSIPYLVNQYKSCIECMYTVVFMCVCRYLRGHGTGWVCGRLFWSIFLPDAFVVQTEKRYVSFYAGLQKNVDVTVVSVKRKLRELFHNCMSLC